MIITFQRAYEALNNLTQLIEYLYTVHTMIKNIVTWIINSSIHWILERKGNPYIMEKNKFDANLQKSDENKLQKLQLKGIYVSNSAYKVR